MPAAVMGVAVGGRLSVLNYQVTCNHVHLLVHDRGGDEIAHDGVSIDLAKQRPAVTPVACASERNPAANLDA